MTTNKERRAEIAAKVRALLAKTIENGCTEQEAILAAKKANELMQEYDLTYTDLKEEICSGDYVWVDETGIRNDHPVVYWLAASIGLYFDCRATSGVNVQRSSYFGLADDAEAAMLMTRLLVVAFDLSWKEFLKSPERPKDVSWNRLRTSYGTGFCTRVHRRLSEMKDARSKASKTGNALVIRKSEALAEACLTDDRFKGARKAVSSNKDIHVNPQAYHAGRAAGSSVDLGGKKIGGAA